MKNAIKYAGYLVLTIVGIVVFVLVVKTAFAREMTRQDAVRAWNCQHYGEAINKHYGREICPPTVNG